jgi:hypothetical protein
MFYYMFISTNIEVLRTILLLYFFYKYFGATHLSYFVSTIENY